MKHGDKAKAKSAKAKASGKKEGRKAGSEGKTVKSSKAAGKKESSDAGKSPKAAGEKSGNGKQVPTSAQARRGAPPAPEPAGFANAVVGNAFRRAVKKYPAAFRKLTD
jgi:hypothetical protein